jgi:alkanesulfonate monooxygenase SsuD/methylene tetrahydromethanopterin reductase-like flavin-dependent oxidoreductase (luciferase family)
VVAAAARGAGRDPEDITVAPYVPAVVAEDPEEARDAIRGHVAYYVGSGEGYKKAVASRFPEAAERVASAWRAGDREEATDAVTDEMVAALGIAGRPDEARAQLRELVEASTIDRPLVVVPNQVDETLGERTVEALAPERL